MVALVAVSTHPIRGTRQLLIASLCMPVFPEIGSPESRRLMVTHHTFLPYRKPADRGGEPAALLAEQLRYWRTQLEGVTAPDLPIKQPGWSGTASTTVTHTFAMPPEVAKRMAAL